MKVLLVDAERPRAEVLQALLAASGAEVSVAPSGSFALTMLEWNKQDVIVSRSRIDDMDGHELCSIVRSDPSTKDIRFVLIASPEEATAAETAAAGIDLALPSSMTGAMIVPLVVQLVRRDHGGTPVHDLPNALLAAVAPHIGKLAAAPPPITMPVRAPAPPAPPPTVAPEPVAPVVPAPTAPPAPSRAVGNGAGSNVRLSDLHAVGAEGAVKTFQGSLGVMEMEDLVQAISTGGKTGRLLLVLSAGGGMIVFNSGRVVHAEFGTKSGEPAFEALVCTAHRERSGKFCFIPSDGHAPANSAATISKSTAHLLLSVATAIDEER
jgi:CheY-like chemotaxis protein